MRLITTNDIETWGNTIDCQYNLPHLIRKLIIATIDVGNIKCISFPYGDDIQTGGYDGELTSISENIFVPLGESVWEFGTTNNKKGKADEDYQKRKENPLGKIPNETTYININAKKYRDKKKWCDEKRSEGFWKDVKFYDAIDIDQWLELAPSVEIWFAEKLRKPTFGIYSALDYWNTWSNNGKIKVVPQIIAGNSRSNEIQKVKDFFDNNDGVLYLKSITIDEAIAFPLAIIEQMGERDKDVLHDRTIIIDNKDSFSRIIQYNFKLTIIVKFNIGNIEINNAVLKGHKLIIPLSPSDEVTTGVIQLPIVSNDDFENGLLSMGINREQSRLLTSSSGRNISVLRRSLEIDTMLPKWITKVNPLDIIPMLVVNQFSENYEGDKQIIQSISSKSYAEYEKFLFFLLNQEDTPIYHLNGVWKLISPTDVWLHAAKYITKDDFDTISKIAIDVLTEINYKYTIPLEQRGSIFQTPSNRPNYSSKIKKGISETLNILAVFGNKYGVTAVSSDYFVDKVINEVLNKSLVVWRSLNENLMALAEASPTIFLNNLERIIKDKSITDFFEEEVGLLHNSNDLPYVLWSLDVIGWMPENLMRVSTALCDLIILTPKKLPTTNSPYDSLKSIFRTWYPQTNANAEDRKTILGILIKKYPDIIFNIMVGMVSSKNGTAMHIPRPKMRMFSELREIRVMTNEIIYMLNFYIDMILEKSKNDFSKAFILIDLLDDVDWHRINEVLEVIETLDLNDIEKRNEIYQKFRQFIGRHRSYPDANWSLPIDILNKIEEIANKFKTEDIILNGLFLFDDQAPIFIEGKEDEDWQKRHQMISDKRVEFVKEIILKYGLEKVFELARNSEHPYLFGNALAVLDNLETDNRLKVYEKIGSEDNREILLAIEFIRVSEIKSSQAEQLVVLEKLIENGLSKDGIVRFYNSLNSSINLWKYLEEKDNEIESLYWKSIIRELYINNKVELLFAVKKLNIFNKHIVLLNTLGMGLFQQEVKKDLTSDEVLKILEEIDLSSIDDNAQFDQNHFNYIMKFLYGRDDYDEERGAKVEMKFFFTFSGHYSVTPKNLFKVMSKKPQEYFDFLTWFYLPEDEELAEKELQEREKQENSKLFYEFKYNVFDKFNLIPSMQEDGSLDEKVLTDWINKVRDLAQEKSKLKSADNCIGKMLAKYPISLQEKKGFPKAIYNIIEAINTHEIKLAFDVQLSNNMSFTSRGAYEGGNIERFRAEYFNFLFEQTKITHPNVSLIFKNKRDEYLKDSYWEDENALLRSLN